MLDLTRSGDFMIGEVSAHTGVHIETIRYYEKIGVMRKPARTSGGNRVYDIEQVRRLNFIKRSRDLGFNLKEIRQLLELVDGGAFSCGDIHAIAVKQIDNVREKIRNLRRLERVLRTMASQCDRGIVPECPIVDALSVI